MKKKKTVRQEKFEEKKSYTHDKAMQEAAKRAQYQPKLITVSSKVKDKP